MIAGDLQLRRSLPQPTHSTRATAAESASTSIRTFFNHPKHALFRIRSSDIKVLASLRPFAMQRVSSSAPLHVAKCSNAQRQHERLLGSGVALPEAPGRVLQHIGRTGASCCIGRASHVAADGMHAPDLRLCASGVCMGVAPLPLGLWSSWRHFGRLFFKMP